MMHPTTTTAAPVQSYPLAQSAVHGRGPNASRPKLSAAEKQRRREELWEDDLQAMHAECAHRTVTAASFTITVTPPTPPKQPQAPTAPKTAKQTTAVSSRTKKLAATAAGAATSAAAVQKPQDMQQSNVAKLVSAASSESNLIVAKIQHITMHYLAQAVHALHEGTPVDTVETALRAQIAKLAL